MTAHKFDQPVSVFIGLGFPREIDSVLDAYDMLLEWNGIPDIDYHAAVDTCHKTLNGTKTVQEAREAFERFAANRGLLSDEAFDRAANDLAQDWGTLTP